MKRTVSILCILAFAILSATSFPAPQFVSKSFGWTASPDPRATNYIFYYVIGPTNIAGWDGTNVMYRSYTNSFSCGNVTSTVFIFPRGYTFYASVTAQGDGEESDYCNEVRWTTRPKVGAASKLQDLNP